MTPPERTGTHVELYHRETLPSPARGRREHVEARLSALESAGAIAGYDVSTWPKRVPCDEEADAAVRDRYLAFAAWAAEQEVRLTPFFGTRECYSMATGDRGDWVVLPALCLAVYEGDRLASVFPHADGDTYRSVLSGLQDLADRPESGSMESVAVKSAD